MFICYAKIFFFTHLAMYQNTNGKSRSLDDIKIVVLSSKLSLLTVSTCIVGFQYGE